MKGVLTHSEKKYSMNRNYRNRNKQFLIKCLKLSSFRTLYKLEEKLTIGIFLKFSIKFPVQEFFQIHISLVKLKHDFRLEV